MAAMHVDQLVIVASDNKLAEAFPTFNRDEIMSRKQDERPSWFWDAFGVDFGMYAGDALRRELLSRLFGIESPTGEDCEKVNARYMGSYLELGTPGYLIVTCGLGLHLTAEAVERFMASLPGGAYGIALYSNVENGSIPAIHTSFWSLTEEPSRASRVCERAVEIVSEARQCVRSDATMIPGFSMLDTSSREGMMQYARVAADGCWQAFDSDAESVYDELREAFDEGDADDQDWQDDWEFLAGLSDLYDADDDEYSEDRWALWYDAVRDGYREELASGHSAVIDELVRKIQERC